MVRRTAVVLALAVGIPLVGCQPSQEQAGGGAGGEQQAKAPAMGEETAGDHFEEAYTNLAEVHISLVQGDWSAAADNMQDVRENLDAMKPAPGQTLPADVTTRINDLQRSAMNLDQLIAKQDPAAIEQSRMLMNTFTRESTLAQVGRTGGGAGMQR